MESSVAEHVILGRYMIVSSTKGSRPGIMGQRQDAALGTYEFPPTPFRTDSSVVERHSPPHVAITYLSLYIKC